MNSQSSCLHLISAGITDIHPYSQLFFLSMKHLCSQCWTTLNGFGHSGQVLGNHLFVYAWKASQEIATPEDEGPAWTPGRKAKLKNKNRNFQTLSNFIQEAKRRPRHCPRRSSKAGGLLGVGQWDLGAEFICSQPQFPQV